MAVINGTSNKETLSGTSGDDEIFGGAGNDTLLGGAGNDTLHAGDDNDNVFGGGGNDVIFGDAGNDNLYGDAGNDVIHGGTGNNTMYGGVGDDEFHVTVGGGVNTISGQSGNDTLVLEMSSTDLTDAVREDLATLRQWLADQAAQFGASQTGQSTGDVLTLSALQVSVNTIENAKLVIDGVETTIDAVLADGGADPVTPVDGNGTNEDGYVEINGGSEKDIIGGSKNNDLIHGGDGNDNINGDDGDDIIYGDAGDDILTGSAGNDVIYGGEGNNTLYGGGDHDELHGGSGDDAMHGDGGDDVFFGGGGSNTMFGGDGNDVFHVAVGAETNTISGERGVDTLVLELSSAQLSNEVRADLATLKEWLAEQTAAAGSTEALAAQASGATLTLNALQITVSSIEGVTVMVDGVETPIDNLINRAPVADATVSVTTNEDTAISGNVGATDADGDTLSYAVAGGPANGVLTLDGVTGAYTYTPNADFNGSDSFSVTVSDGQGGTATQTVTVGITPVNDAPVADAAVSLTTVEDTAASGTVVASDIEGDTLSYAVAGGPANGVLTLDGVTGAYTYTPNADFNGNDSFSVIVSDSQGGTATQTVTVGVTPANDAPVAAANVSTSVDEDGVLSGGVGASDVDGDTLSYAVANGPANGTLTLNSATGAYSYQGNQNFSGSDSFDILVSDGHGGTVTQTVDVTVDGVADTPQLSTNDAEVFAGISLVSIGSIINVNLGSSTKTFSLDIDAGLTDVDGSETLAITIGGVPTGATLSAGTHNTDGSWTLSAGDLDGLTMTASTGSDFSLTVTATATEANGDSSSASQQLDVTFTYTSLTTILGTNGSEVIYGTNGDDVISDLGGNDYVYGFDGNDIFVVGSGNDSFYGGNGFDLVDLSGATSGVTVNLSSGYLQGSSVGWDWLSSIEGVIGSSHGDTINGNYQDNVIDAGAGNDTINTGGGNNIVDAGDGNDQINATSGDDYLYGGSGNDTINTGGGNDYVDAGDGNDQVNASKGNDTIYGGAGNDIINGNGGNDFIDAGDGNDQVNAGSGHDIIYTGDGNDTINSNGGNDTIYIGGGSNVIHASSGFDTLNYSLATSSINVNMGSGTGITTGFSNDTFDGVEQIIGSEFADTFLGSSGSDVFSGGGGDDQFRGLGGSDIFTGGDGNDTFIWEASDVVSGRRSLGTDTITDFTVGEDILDLSAFTAAFQNQDIDDIIRVQDSASGAVVSVKVGSSFYDVVILDDVHGVTTGMLFDSGSLIA